MIWHSKPTLSAAEQKAIGRVLRSGYLSEGPEVARFEQMVASSLGLADGVALSSGTAALHLALLSLGVGKGDEVIMPSYVCTSLLDAVNYVGAQPVVVDICPVSLNIDATATECALTKRTKAIIVPHLLGNPAAIDCICDLGVPVIEDAAQTVGIEWLAKPIGSWGDVTVISFYATKLLTTGYGGMMLARRKKHVERARDLKTFDERNQYKVRYHYSMSDVQAAMGIEQWQRLPKFIRKRRAIGRKYSRAAGESSASSHNGAFFRFLLKAPESADDWIEAFRTRGIEAKRPVYRPLHRYLKLDRRDFPVAEWAHHHVLSVPLYPSLTRSEVDAVSQAIGEVVGS